MIKIICATVKTLTVALLFSSVINVVTGEPVFSQEIDECIECHMDIHLTTTDDTGKVHSLYVDKEAYLNDVHFEKEKYSCIKCHEGVETDSHPEDGIPDVKCANSDCHEEVLLEYEKSKHGDLSKTGDPDAPQCYDCHSMHEVLPADNPESTINPENLSATCGKCHEQEAFEPLLTLIATRFKGHGKVDMACSFSTKRCTDCHFEVSKHGCDELKPKECVICHAEEKSSILFGTIHRSGLLKSPLLLAIMVCLYLAGISGIVYYFRPSTAKK